MLKLDYRTKRNIAGQKDLAVPAFAAIPVGILGAATIALTAEVACRLPSNHWDFDTSWLLALPAVAMCYAVLFKGMGLLTRRGAMAIIVAVLVNGVAVMGADRLNLLVDYDVWIGRGMPSPWQYTP